MQELLMQTYVKKTNKQMNKLKKSYLILFLDALVIIMTSSSRNVRRELQRERQWNQQRPK